MSIAVESTKSPEQVPDDVILLAKNIWKRFPGVVALKGVTIDVRKGEILGLVGENGAGKSTFLKILYGVYQPDEGEIILEGKKVVIHDPIHAMNLGIFYVPQEIILPPNMSVAEAMLLGCKFKGVFKRVNYKLIYEEARKALAAVGLEDLDPSKLVKELDTATRQLILVARGLALKSKILIFDEPTSSLGPEESERLLNLMVKQKSEGRTIIFVSHRVEEVLRVADRIVVLRDGRKVAEFDNRDKKVSIDAVIKAMVAREIKEFYPKEPVPIGRTVLEVENLTTTKVSNVSFNVRQGEILGIFGLLGSGIHDVARALAGYEKIISGTIKIDGAKIKITKPIDAIKNGILYIPEDRRGLGLIPLLNVKENISIVSLDLMRILKMGLASIIDKGKERNLARDLIKKLRIVPPDPNKKVMYLSGGNQQKVVVSRAFTRPVKVIIFSEPTTGIDVGAKVEIRRLMVELAKRGNSIILVSSDAHEICGMADRVIVMVKGRVVAELKREEASPEKLLKLAAVSK